MVAYFSIYVLHFDAVTQTVDRMLSSTPDVDNVLLFDHNLTLANGDLLSKRRGRSVVGPGDDTTNPSAILLLKGHEAEVRFCFLLPHVHELILLQVFVCAWNPAKPALLATGYVWLKVLREPYQPTTATIAF